MRLLRIGNRPMFRWYYFEFDPELWRDNTRKYELVAEEFNRLAETARYGTGAFTTFSISQSKCLIQIGR